MTSDVGVLITPRALRPGDTVDFALDYDALVRAVTSPYVDRRFVSRTVRGATPAGGSAGPAGGSAGPAGGSAGPAGGSAGPAGAEPRTVCTDPQEAQ